MPVVVDESLRSFEDPRNRERFEQILGSPEMQGAIQETARALVEGALEPGDRASTSQSVTDSMADVLARDIRDRILPADRRRDARFAERRLLAAGPAGHAALSSTRPWRRATAAAIRSASAELPSTLAPAMRGALVDSLNSPELHAAVVRVSRPTRRARPC